MWCKVCDDGGIWKIQAGQVCPRDVPRLTIGERSEPHSSVNRATTQRYNGNRIHENIEQKQESDSWSLRVDAQFTMMGRKCTFQRAIQDIIEPQWTQHRMYIIKWPILNRGHRRSSHNRKAPDMTCRLFRSHFSINWKKANLELGDSSLSMHPKKSKFWLSTKHILRVLSKKGNFFMI